MNLTKILCIALILFACESTAKLKPLEKPDLTISLCECILSVIKKYVSTKTTITVTLTEKFNNVTAISLTETILERLTSETKWTVLTKDVTKSKVTSRTYYPLQKISKSYIIFATGCTGDISRNLKRLKTSDSWNSLSYFFIVSLTICQKPFRVAYEILQTLWTEELINGVVLLANPKNTIVLNTYVAKPYVKGNCGKKLDKIELIDTCTKGAFRRNKDLFKNNIPKSLSNCTLSVGFAKMDPFVIDVKNHSTVIKEYYYRGGLEINLLTAIANHLELKLIYYEEEVGEIFPNGTATGNLLQLKEGKIDIAIASYFKTFERCHHFDCSSVYFQSTLVWCVPHMPVLVHSYNFLNVFDATSWLLLILLFLAAAIAIWLVSVINGVELSPYRDYRNVFQYVFSILLGFPVGSRPKTFPVRTIFIFIVFFSFYMDTVYLSFLTSVLTGSLYREKYNSEDDIYKNNLTSYLILNGEKYFQGEKFQYILDRAVRCVDYKICMDYVVFRRDSAFCVPETYADFVRNSYVSKNRDALLHCFGNIVSLKTNMLMRKGFPLFYKIDKLIGKLGSGGFIRKWRNDIITTKSGNILTNIYRDEDQFLMFANLKPVFSILIFGHCFAIFIFIIELNC